MDKKIVIIVLVVVLVAVVVSNLVKNDVGYSPTCKGDSDCGDCEICIGPDAKKGGYCEGTCLNVEECYQGSCCRPNCETSAGNPKVCGAGDGCGGTCDLTDGACS